MAQRERDIPERTALVVLGMHRSGTSALTRVLNLCGAALPQTLMGPREDNVAGMWESERIFRLTENVLHSVGMRWDDVRELPVSWFESDAMSDYRAELARAIDEEFGDEPLVVIKDPRLSRLVPFLEGALSDVGMAPRYVIAMRNPLEVAESLRVRNGLAPARSMLLWLRHVLEGEAATGGRDRVFVDYEDLLADWRAVVDGIGTELGVSWAGRTTKAEIAIERFLSRELRHHRAGAPDPEESADVTGQIEAVYTWCRRVAAGEQPSGKPLEEARQWLAEADRCHLAALVGDESITLQQVQDLVRLRADRQEQAEVLARVRKERDEQRRVVKELEGQRERLTSELEQLQADRDGEAELLGQVREECEGQRRAAQGLEQERDRLTGELERLQADRDEYRETLERERDEHRRMVDGLQRERDRVSRELEGLRADRDEHAEALTRAREERDLEQRKVRSLEGRVNELEKHIDGLRAEHDMALARVTDELVRAQETVGVRNRQLAELLASTSWRATAPMRWLSRRVRGGVRLLTRAVSLGGRALSRLATLPAATRRLLRNRLM